LIWLNLHCEMEDLASDPTTSSVTGAQSIGDARNPPPQYCACGSMEIEPLLDPYRIEGLADRIGQIQCFERAPDEARGDHLAVPFPER
jgi:hypothetical protein